MVAPVGLSLVRQQRCTSTPCGYERRGCIPRRWSSGIAWLSYSMFVTSLATSKRLSWPAYVAGVEIDKPMNSIDSSMTTQPTKLTSIAGGGP